VVRLEKEGRKTARGTGLVGKLQTASHTGARRKTGETARTIHLKEKKKRQQRERGETFTDSSDSLRATPESGWSGLKGSSKKGADLARGKGEKSLVRKSRNDLKK